MESRLKEVLAAFEDEILIRVNLKTSDGDSFLTDEALCVMMKSYSEMHSELRYAEDVHTEYKRIEALEAKMTIVGRSIALDVAEDTEI